MPPVLEAPSLNHWTAGEDTTILKDTNLIRVKDNSQFNAPEGH